MGFTQYIIKHSEVGPLRGGKRGLLQNSTNLCKVPHLSSVMNLKAQNGKRRRNNRLSLEVSGC